MHAVKATFRLINRSTLEGFDVTRVRQSRAGHRYGVYNATAWGLPQSRLCRSTKEVRALVSKWG